MSWCEDYEDPFPRECEHGSPDGINCDSCFLDAIESQSEEWQCADPVHCLNPNFIHHRSECYTAEDAEALSETITP